jgi:7-cyano-7-deazaguanine synthase in queuosine biosynthesis
MNNALIKKYTEQLKEFNIDNDSNILLMFSGGLDSTGALWNLLKDKKNKIHLHHLYLLNKENRADAEQNAVQNILSYIKQRHTIKYSESYHQYPFYSYLKEQSKGLALHQNFMFDSDIYNFIAGTICFCLPNIKKVAIGRTKSDASLDVETRSVRGTKLLQLFAPNIEKIYPVEHLTKTEIYNILPKELRDMTWSCRTPINVDNMFKECGACKTCIEINQIKNGI